MLGIALKKLHLSENSILIIIPFALSAAFITFGYTILAATTPEARVAPNIHQAQAEIITEDDYQHTAPNVPRPEVIKPYYAQLPEMQLKLDQIIENAQEAQANTIYFSMPVTIKDDHTVEPTTVHQTSIENLTRWVKKSISTAHQNDLHAVFALNYNASTTISDYNLFQTNLSEFLHHWAVEVNQVSVSYFNLGLTIGHPIFSNLPESQVNSLLANAQQTVRRDYVGQLGVNFCCQANSQVSPKGFTFLVAIPTPEFDQSALIPQIQTFQANNSISQIFFFDRESKQLRLFENNQ